MTESEYRNTVDYLFGLQMVGIKLGLDNIRLLLAELGNPQKRCPVVHIAGTNGKGSTAAFLASILTESGYRTGLYTSPHLVDFSERIRIDGTPISEAEVVAFTARVRPTVDEHRMTFFETTTAMAFQYFADNDCDVAVVETGLGGRLDATNVVDPAVTIITSLGIEHTEFLGDTLEEIAAEKGGIIKDEGPLLTAVTQPQALDVLQTICSKHRAPMERILPPLVPPQIRNIDEMVVSLEVFGRPQELALELVGEYQVLNAALAIRAAELLYEKGQKRITGVTISEGVRHVRRNTGIAGRLWRMSTNPDCILDVAHNPAAVEVMLATVLKLRPSERLHLVFGLMGTKDYKQIVRMLAAYSWASVSIVQASAPGALPVERLEAEARAGGLDTVRGKSVRDAVQAALKNCGAEDAVLVFGSHYVIGEYLSETEFP